MKTFLPSLIIGLIAGLVLGATFIIPKEVTNNICEYLENGKKLPCKNLDEMKKLLEHLDEKQDAMFKLNREYLCTKNGGRLEQTYYQHWSDRKDPYVYKCIIKGEIYDWRWDSEWNREDILN